MLPPKIGKPMLMLMPKYSYNKCKISHLPFSSLFLLFSSPVLWDKVLIFNMYMCVIQSK